MVFWLGLPNNALTDVPCYSLAPLVALDRLDLSNNRIKSLKAVDFMVSHFRFFGNCSDSQQQQSINCRRCPILLTWNSPTIRYQAYRSGHFWHWKNWWLWKLATIGWATIPIVCRHWANQLTWGENGFYQPNKMHDTNDLASFSAESWTYRLIRLRVHWRVAPYRNCHRSSRWISIAIFWPASKMVRCRISHRWSRFRCVTIKSMYSKTMHSLA